MGNSIKEIVCTTDGTAYIKEVKKASKLAQDLTEQLDKVAKMKVPVHLRSI